DVLVEYNSRAAEHFREMAQKVVRAFIDHSSVVQFSGDDPYKPGKVLVEKNKMIPFKNALHEGYSDLNGFEQDFADALDKTQRVWCRNPSQGVYSIPLLDYGNTASF